MIIEEGRTLMQPERKRKLEEARKPFPSRSGLGRKRGIDRERDEIFCCNKIENYNMNHMSTTALPENYHRYRLACLWFHTLHACIHAREAGMLRVVLEPGFG